MHPSLVQTAVASWPQVLFCRQRPLLRSVRVLEGPRVPALAERARAIEAGLVVLRAGIARRVEALIDEIGSQSFPASDPPAWVR